MTVTLFTDLDGTILFSKNSLPSSLTQQDCTPVETYAQQRHGYIEKELLIFLSEWSQKNLFIPITTRSTTQFERLHWPAELLLPFALTSNGGNLYRFGSLDNTWHMQTQQLLEKALTYKKQVRQWIEQKIPNQLIKKVKEIDQWYFCIILSCRSNDEAFFQEFTKELAAIEWCAYFQEKKWYILPQALSKEAAIHRLQAELPKANLIKTMGDTTMDLAMITQYPNSLYFGKHLPALSKKKYTHSCL